MIRLDFSKIWYVLLLLFTAPVYGSVKETFDRIELNWSTMKIRFSGKADGRTAAVNSFQEVTERALQEGLSYLVQEFPKLRAKRLGREENDADRALAHQIASSTYIYNTTYYANGQVEVDLESSLARAMTVLNSEAFTKVRAENLPSSHSAIVIRLNRSIPAMPTYQIVAPDQNQVLFQMTDVAQEEFEKNLMGRWFQTERAREFRSFIGENPIVIDAEISESYDIKVVMDQWNRIRQEDPGLLETARIAIVIPKS